MKASKKTKSESDSSKKRSLFDHVKHIKQVQTPSYYSNLSDDDRKSFNHFMILRALSMDDSLVEDMADLYQYFDKIPSPQFYTLLITMIPKSNSYSPWIKSKVMKHNKELLEYVAKRFQIPKYQANAYVNILLRSEEGQEELIRICKVYGLSDDEVQVLFDEKKD
jgi:hypothetical protein